MAEEIASILEQARLLVLQHAPADLLKEAVPFGIICLVAGIGLSVLGAKLSRIGITCGFGLLGAYIGAFVARQTGFPMLVCSPIGAVMMGVIGYQTLKLWVGMVAALVLSTAAMGVFSYQRILPHYGEFEQAAPASFDGSETFALPSPEEHRAYLERSPKQWAQEYWAFVTQKDADVGSNGRAVALTAMITGLCLGVVAARWALIVSTSLIGTALVTTALASLMRLSVPESYQAFQRHPSLVGVAVGAFLVSSLVIQTLLTRKAPDTKAESSRKS